MRIVDLINDCISENRRFFGVEFFPPKAEAAVANLYDRMHRMSDQLGPLFCSVTSDDSTAEESIEIAATMKQLMNATMQVNITGADATKDKIRSRLQALKAKGIQNICVVRGNPSSSINPDFPHAVDLVKFVRKEFGDFFGVAVAAYPEGHSEDRNEQEALNHLKEKVEAGADLIITLAVFDTQVFLDFCSKCRAKGIHCPILPGIMPVHSYTQFSRRLLSYKGASQLGDQLKAVKNDDAEVQRIASAWTVHLIKQLLRGGVRGIYIYSMNLESPVVRIVEGTGLTGRTRLLHEFGGVNGASSTPAESIPTHWRRSRSDEEVRPIFWAGRTNSYLARTSQWDEFPNGRWSSMASPAFRNDTTYHTQLAVSAHAKQCCRFRQVTSLEDICQTFLAFLDGQSKLPWAEDELSAEAGLLMDDVLKPFNARGLFTINSQPPVNGASSTNKVVGWGPVGGYVYQKQYLEFFVSPANLQIVLEVFGKFPSLSYLGMNSTKSVVVSNHSAARTGSVGSKDDSRTTSTPPSLGPSSSPTSNTAKDSVTALTWGVFPGREIVQPTIHSTAAFVAWVEEAFSLWEAAFDNGVAIPPIITEIRQNWVLLNVVDNDFIRRPTPLNMAVSEICQRIPTVVVPSPSTVTPPDSRQSSNVTLLTKPALPIPGSGPSASKLLAAASVNDLSELGFGPTRPFLGGSDPF
jgi:methylenetetrahydrofolate reductase (NADPH)